MSLEAVAVLMHERPRTIPNIMENPYLAPQAEIYVPTGAKAEPLTWKQILFSFKGRIPRRQFWGGSGILFLCGFVLQLLIGVFLQIFLRQRDLSSPEAVRHFVNMVMTITFVFYIPIFWANLALAVKRWHDRDKSGWWIFILLIPIIGFFWYIVEVGCLRGTEGANKYGEDPT